MSEPIDSSSRRLFLKTSTGAAALAITASSFSFGRTHALQIKASLPAPPGPDRLPAEWYQRKIKQVQAKMAERNLNALVLLNAHNVVYTTGYFHLPTERPLAALIPASGEPALFIPELESDQVKLWWVKDYEAYFDYPGPVNRVRWIFERINARGVGPNIGVEECTPSRRTQMQLGAPKAKLVDAGDIVDQMRWVKDQDEIGVMRRSIYFRRLYGASRTSLHRGQRQRHRRRNPEGIGRCRRRQDVEGVDIGRGG